MNGMLIREYVIGCENDMIFFKVGMSYIYVSKVNWSVLMLTLCPGRPMVRKDAEVRVKFLDFCLPLAQNIESHHNPANVSC
jgi:hypothetical protein